MIQHSTMSLASGRTHLLSRIVNEHHTRSGPTHAMDILAIRVLRETAPTLDPTSYCFIHTLIMARTTASDNHAAANTA